MLATIASSSKRLPGSGSRATAYAAGTPAASDTSVVSEAIPRLLARARGIRLCESTTS